MQCFEIKVQAKTNAVTRIFLVEPFRLWMMCSLVMACLVLVSSSFAATRTAKPDPEVLLLEVYKDLGANHLRAAQQKADALVEAYPNFRLGQLIRGDLLQMHTRPVTSFGAAPKGSEEQVQDLREEAIARLRSLREKPNPGLVPRALLQLRDDQKYALIVDTKRSRLYVYGNQNGNIKFITDYYISQGKLGINKIKAGDQKTPLGVYYITQRLAGKKLPDFYGVGALPINYPNDWDKRSGRSGSGIWLHGTPSNSFSRPPLSSDGCVVLTNPDLHQLYSTVEINNTPVVITDKVEFVSKAAWDSERKTARKLLDNWRDDVESGDSNRIFFNYSKQFRSDRGESLRTWFDKQKKALSNTQKLSIKFRDVTFFLYPGREELIVGTFTQDSVFGKSKHSVRKRQYWAKEGSQWRIVSESNL